MGLSTQYSCTNRYTGACRCGPELSDSGNANSVEGTGCGDSGVEPDEWQWVCAEGRMGRRGVDRPDILGGNNDHGSGVRVARDEVGKNEHGRSSKS